MRSHIAAAALPLGGLLGLLLALPHPNLQPASAQTESEASETAPAEEPNATPIYQAPKASSEGRVRTARLEPLPIYIAPLDLGSPRQGVSGGTRSGGRVATIHVLAPDHVGLTTESQPVLYWYLGQDTGDRIDVTLRDQDSVEPLLDVRLPAPQAAGIHAFRLADYGVQLEPGRDYQWFVSIVPDPERRSRDFISGAWIRRKQRSGALTKRLQREEPVIVYADESLWYDALAAVSQDIESDPAAKLPRAQRAALLSQVGLAEVAALDSEASR